LKVLNEVRVPRLRDLSNYRFGSIIEVRVPQLKDYEIITFLSSAYSIKICTINLRSPSSITCTK